MEVNLLELDGAFAELQFGVADQFTVNLYDQIVVLCLTKTVMELSVSKSLLAVIIKILP